MSASDTEFVIGNWKTKSFANWWLEKLGINKNDFSNKYTMAGTNYEHKILDSLKIKNLEKDKQIIIGKLRVNLDGNTSDTIYEVKTYNYENGFVLPKKYVHQVLVQMYADNKRIAYVVAYGLLENDYKNYFNEIDSDRLTFFKIPYDEDFINNEYLPKLNYLSDCLERGVFPNESFS